MTNETRLDFYLIRLGAGDLIDRAVRFYRKNFWTFIWIAAPPIFIGTLVSVGWTIAGRQIFSAGAARSGSAEMVGYYLFRWLGGISIWTAETVATLTVMGGASRNFVRHLLFGEPITFRETYKNTAKRIIGLLAASVLITCLLGFIGLIIFYFGMFVGFILVAIAVATFSFSPFLAALVSLVLGLAVFFGSLWLFFLAASRFAYVPQVMLVEGLGVVSAIGKTRARYFRRTSCRRRNGGKSFQPSRKPSARRQLARCDSQRLHRALVRIERPQNYRLGAL